MEINKLGGLIAGIVVAALLLAAVLVPIIDSTQKTIGPATTVTNTAVDGNYDYQVWDRSDITFTYTGLAASENYTIDGESSGLDFSTNTQRIVIASDVFCTRTGGSVPNVNLNSQYVGATSQLNGASFVFQITDGEYSLTFSGQDPITGTLGWLVYAIDGGTANLMQIKVPTSPFYTSDTNNIIVLGNIYVTGDNDTFYSYYDGVLSVNAAYADVSSVDITQTLADGYSDIYNTGVTVNVGDESFTPYFILAPKTASGHETDTMYDLLGIIPILMTVAIILGVVAMAFVRRE